MKQPSTWSEFLKIDFANRQRADRRFSLRSYARLLGVSPSYLSSMMTGQRSVTPSMAVRFGESLGLTLSEAVSWLKEDPREKKRVQRELSEREFSPISDWHFYAILSLASLKVNSAEPAWVAKKLRLPLPLATSSLKLLLQNGYLAVERGQLRLAGGNLRTKNDVPSAAVRRYHRRVLQVAQERLMKVQVEQREFAHMTLAIDPARMSKAKEKIREFIEELTSEFTTKNASAVYHLNLQFYPVSESK